MRPANVLPREEMGPYSSDLLAALQESRCRVQAEGEGGGDRVSDRERILWQAISRGLKLIVNAIDQYLGKEAPTGAADKR